MTRSLVVLVFALGCGAHVDAPTEASARVRVADVSPGAPAVDFCLAVHGTARFAGPILAGAGRTVRITEGRT